jgi:hypothetical protein
MRMLHDDLQTLQHPQRRSLVIFVDCAWPDACTGP